MCGVPSLETQTVSLDFVTGNDPDIETPNELRERLKNFHLLQLISFVSNEGSLNSLSFIDKANNNHKKIGLAENNEIQKLDNGTQDIVEILIDWNEERILRLGFIHINTGVQNVTFAGTKKGVTGSG